MTKSRINISASVCLHLKPCLDNTRPYTFRAVHRRACKNCLQIQLLKLENEMYRVYSFGNRFDWPPSNSIT